MMTLRSKIFYLGAVSAVLIAAAGATWVGLPKPAADVEARLAGIDQAARVRLLPDLFKNEIDYPPRRLALLVFADRKAGELLAQAGDGKWHLVRRYEPINAAHQGTFYVSGVEADGAKGVSITLSGDETSTARIALRARPATQSIQMPESGLHEIATLAKQLARDDFRVVIAATDWRQTALGDDASPAVRSLANVLISYAVQEPPQPLLRGTGGRRLQSLRPVPVIARSDSVPEPTAVSAGARDTTVSLDGANALTVQGL